MEVQRRRNWTDFASTVYRLCALVVFLITHRISTLRSLTYRTNKAKVLFLRRRSSTLRQQRQENNSRDFYSCIVCGRSLQDNTLYCSIECKVLAVDGENHKDADEKRIDENIVKLKPRQSSRKGVPFRAPMF
ncbi:hypothetical protein HS088_TW13G00650 [Tripterygium wilfordii]|uniref:PLATZ transcription factor family protein n=1 Tax=Tripterygium wilfordii TaxID=458696 RepID=A0A7J7CUJ2_TRIWF|nr:hypothetical protein HS088_TW13G00650 [Tripterygium wilfordii]